MSTRRTSGPTRHRSAAASVGLVGVVVLSVGVASGVVIGHASASTPDAAAPGVQTVAVSSELFDDTRTVAVAPQVADPLTVTVGDVGRITRSTCATGAVISSGSSPLTVDDRPVIALATSVPLWRDVTPGTKGDDIAALQGELVRLGYKVTVDGVVGRSTTTAIKALLTTAGFVRPTGVLAAASVMWLPAPEVTVASCEARVGDQTDGDPLATVGGGLIGLQVTADLSDALPGDRVLTYHDLTAPVGADGLITDPAFLAALASGPEANLALAGTSALTLPAALVTPVEVVVVPPSALYDLSGSAGCIVADGTPRAVTVVSSSLGQTMVVPADGVVPSRVATNPGQDGSC